MGAYRSVVVGTDGAHASPRAVARSGGHAGATRVVVCASLPGEDDRDLLGSVPADGTRRSGVDVLVVHTS